MVTVKENVSFTGYAFRIRLSDCSRLAKNRKNENDVTICRHYVITIFVVVLFLSSSLFTGPSFMLISSMVPELYGLNVFSFSRYSNCCIFVFSSFLPVGHCIRRWSKIKLKANDIINCLNKNLITHFVWYLRKKV